MRTESWQARVAHGTAPAERVEAELRYAFAAPLIRDADLWVDLGCGTGVAAGAALGPERPRSRAILVDLDAGVLADARRECGADVADAIEADLSTADGAAVVRAAVEGAGGSCVVTCLHLLQELEDVTALVGVLLALGDRATVVVSVPDDEAGAGDDPRRRSAWSAGAVEELRRLLPEGTLRFRLVTIRAAAIVGEGDAAAAALGSVDVAAGAPAAGHLLAFGPAAGRLAPASRAAAADLAAERADVRRRESDLAYLEARVAAAEAS